MENTNEYLCIEDYVMSDTKHVAFIKGKTYSFDKDYVAISEIGQHFMANEPEFDLYFTPQPNIAEAAGESFDNENNVGERILQEAMDTIENLISRFEHSAMGKDSVKTSDAIIKPAKKLLSKYKSLKKQIPHEAGETKFEINDLSNFYVNINHIKSHDSPVYTKSFKLNQNDELHWSKDFQEWAIILDNFPGQRKCYKWSLPIKTFEEFENMFNLAGVELIRANPIPHPNASNEGFITCKDCNGTGYKDGVIRIGTDCPTCEAWGRVKSQPNEKDALLKEMAGFIKDAKDKGMFVYNEDEKK